MSWRDDWQQASFRGVPFHVERAGGEIGRRKSVHEYPFRDEPYVEDLGRKARRYSFTAFLTGSNLFQQRDQFEAAIEKPGSGTLVHPYYGSLQVECLGARPTYSSKHGGVVRYQINFIEAGKNQYPVASSNARHQLSAAVGRGLKVSNKEFESHLNTKGPGFLFDSATAWIQGGVTQLQALNNQRTWLESTSGINTSINSLSSEITTLVQTPGVLAGRFTGLIASVIGAGRSVLSNFYSDEDLAHRNAQPISHILKTHHGLSSLPVETVPLTTPTRQQQSNNQAAFQEWIRSVSALTAVDAVAEASQSVGVDSISDSPFQSYEQAINVRETLLDSLDVIANASLNDALYSSIRDTQSLLIQHIDAHGMQLPRIRTVQLQSNEPALAVAHRLYGDISQSEDLISRNRISHPNFLPAGTDLETLSPRSTQGDSNG